MHRATSDRVDKFIIEKNLVLLSERFIELFHPCRRPQFFAMSLSQLSPEIQPPWIYLLNQLHNYKDLF